MKTAAQSILSAPVSLSVSLSLYIPLSLCADKALDLRTPKMQNYQNNAKHSTHTHTLKQ